MGTGEWMREGEAFFASALLCPSGCWHSQGVKDSLLYGLMNRRYRHNYALQYRVYWYIGDHKYLQISHNNMALVMRDGCGWSQNDLALFQIQKHLKKESFTSSYFDNTNIYFSINAWAAATRAENKLAIPHAPPTDNECGILTVHRS